ncbi:hypothetical protein IGS68_07275 [Skermanella sp. TT6]|uniref:Uncharacterized protein n=1 Tax=Skermanella cutis TaxID=2775420 RepID=A0ABX7B9H7_9PROT|nr:hypothetical protein [Skermanella sp. TT6]QQP91012.1 hypothetical protein IGS68_07275 [Skermanella sp. TT6]
MTVPIKPAAEPAAILNLARGTVAGSGDRLREVYRLSDGLGDPAMRSTLMEAMRSWLRIEKPPRRNTAQRRFCEPFEELLCGPVGRQRQRFQIPRPAIAPLWDLIASETGKGGSDDLEGCHRALRAVLDRAKADPAFARRQARAYPDFWAIAGEIDCAIRVREPVLSLRRLLAGAVPDRPDPAAVAALGRFVSELGEQDRGSVDLFLMLLARHPETGRSALDLIDALARGAAALPAETLETVYAAAIGDLHAGAKAAFDGSPGTADLNKALDRIEPAARHLTGLKSSAGGRIPRNAARLHRLESELHDLLNDRFLGEVAARTDEHARVLADIGAGGGGGETAGRGQDRRAFDEAMSALARSRQLFKALGRLDAYRREVETVQAQVSRDLGSLADRAASADAGTRRSALEATVTTLHGLERICPGEALMPLLAEGFSKLGGDGTGDLMVDLIRHMNPAPAAATR